MDPLVSAAAIVALVVLIAASPLVAVPIGLLLAMYALTAGAPLLQAAVLGALGTTVTRLLLAWQARGEGGRASSDAARPHRDAMRAWLARSRSYGTATFAAAATPLIPASFLFPLLGSMRAPLRYALAGSFAGQVPLLLLTTWVATWLARALTQGDREAAMLLGIVAVLLVIRKLIDAVDWQHFSETRILRLRDDAREPRFQAFTPGQAPGGWTSSSWGDSDTSGASPALDDVSGEVIEGELVAEELADDGDDAASPDDAGRASPPPAT